MRFRLKYDFIILAVVVAVAMRLFAIRFYPSRPPRIASTDDQVINPVQDSEIFGEVFRDPDFFKRNYAIMEELFKIIAYPPNSEEDHFFYMNKSNIHGVYSSELFFHHSLLVSERFSTRNTSEANMFFIPLNWYQILGKGVYANAENYLRYIVNENPFWNRTRGINHFFVTCNDAGARLSERMPLNNSVTVLCSANRSGRDSNNKFHRITLPQIRLPFVSPVGGNDRHLRTTLAFWACRESEWDGDNLSYQEKFKTSRYCICDGSSYITRICITDSIHYGCVPVILYESYALPFNDLLDWSKFSVIINEDNAHLVERILEAISDSEFSELHNNIRKVQRHFQWNSPPERYDVFHMIMFELWMRSFANFISDSGEIQIAILPDTWKSWRLRNFS